ncbi:MAG TPA: MmcQ/YjbR family DNA-binding protein [Ktedonobacterales bacterium]|jgi:hypothetical protein
MTQQMRVTFETVREIALALPGVEEGTSYGTPAFRVRGKFLARLREDDETLVIKCDYAERDLRLEINPAAFFITDHYRGYPMLLVCLAAVEEDDLRDLLELAWRSLAPKRLLNAIESAAD